MTKYILATALISGILGGYLGFSLNSDKTLNIKIQPPRGIIRCLWIPQSRYAYPPEINNNKHYEHRNNRQAYSEQRK